MAVYQEKSDVSHPHWDFAGTLPIRPYNRITCALEEKLEPLYIDLPYHNWDKHITETLEAASILIARCREFNIPVDEEVVVHAVMGHDALYHLNQKYLGHPNKEVLAASYVKELLNDLGAPQEHCKKVYNCIMATYFGAEPKTTEEMILRAADLWNLGKDPDLAIENTRLLFQEAQRLNNYSGDFLSFVEGSLKYMSPYLIEKLELTPLFYNAEGRSIWHENALNFMVKLLSSACGGRENIKVILQYPIGNSELIFPPHFKGKKLVVIGIDSDRNKLKTFVESGKSKQDAIYYGIPFIGDKFPMPDKSCDIAYVPRGVDFNTMEFSRIFPTTNWSLIFTD